MNNYPDDSFETVSLVLERSAHRLGVVAFSAQDEYLPLHVAFDSAGPMSWALTLHATAMYQLANNTSDEPSSILPFGVTSSDTAPFGSEVVIQPAKLPISTALFYMDAALEHAICIGMRDLGYSPSEWAELPQEQKVVGIEPYLNDLRDNWMTEAIERGGIVEQINAWPSALNQETLEHLMHQEPAQEASHVLRFPSAR